MYPDVSSGGLFSSLVLRSGWCSWYRGCMKMLEANCVLSTAWVKNLFWKWVFTKALAWPSIVIITESREKLPEKLIIWKTNTEGKGLRVNMGKTKVLISGLGHNVLQKSDRDLCDVCLNDVGTNPIFCDDCYSWVHKRCSGISGHLKPGPSFGCKWCTGQVRPVDGKPMTEVTVGRENPDVVPSFCYLRDCLSSCGGCELALIKRCCHVHGANSMSSCIYSCIWLWSSRSTQC